MLVIALVEATQTLFRERFDIGGFSDFKGGWDQVAYLPSQHDLEQWRWYNRSAK
jgi:hypothetical protein